MVLYPDEPWVIGKLDCFRQQAIGRNAGKNKAFCFQLRAVLHVYFIAVAMAFLDMGCAVDGSNPAIGIQCGGLSAETHCATEIPLGGALLELVAPHPFRHQTDERCRARPELG